MKKNLITMLTMTLVLVNLILTVILTITIVPETQKANSLITKICAAIDLDLEAGTVEEVSVPIDQIEVYEISDTMTINLKTGEDGETHYAVLGITLSLDTNNSDYKSLSSELESKETLVKSEIIDVVSSYTFNEIREDQGAVQADILKALQKLFDSDFIIAVGFSSAQYQ